MSRHYPNRAGNGDDSPEVEFRVKGKIPSWKTPHTVLAALLALFGGGGIGASFFTHRDTQTVIEARHRESSSQYQEILDRLNTVEKQLAVLTQRLDDQAVMKTAYLPAKFTETVAP